jgi:hypothetical protein
MAELTPEQSSWIERIRGSENEDLIQKVPQKYLTQDFYLEAVRAYLPSIQQVPVELVMPEMCAIAIASRQINYVPKEKITGEIIAAAIQQNALCIDRIPQEMLTPELCLLAVQRNGRALGAVPEALQTAELCLAAVQQEGDALEYVPDSLRTLELCMEAVKHCRVNLRSLIRSEVPESVQADLCRALVKENSRYLNNVPDELKTDELCLEAVKNGLVYIGSLPEHLRSAEVCLDCIKRTPVESRNENLLCVPEALREQVKKAAGIEG